MNYKKGLMLTMKFGALVAPIVPVISCGKKDVVYDPAKKDSVIMIVNPAGHKDKGFLQGGYEGAQEAIRDIEKLKRFGEMKITAADIPASKVGVNKALQAGGYVILGVGYQYPQFFNGEDYAGKYEDREFIGLDGKVAGTLKPNVTAVEFEAEKAAFLSGVATGIFLAKKYEAYKENGLKVGAFGGGEYPSVQNMIAGFIHGLAYYNEHLAIDSNHKVQFIGWNGSANGFTGGFVPNSVSTTKAKFLLSQKADVVFPVAGGQVSSMVDAIKTKNSKTKIVGVDSDQAKAFGTDGEHFITSSMKNTKTATYEALRAIYEEEGSKLIKGKNNLVGLVGNFVGLAEGVFGGESFKGTALYSFIKGNKIDTTSVKTIFKQLTSPLNDIYMFASSYTSKDWEKAKIIFGYSGSVIPTITDHYS